MFDFDTLIDRSNSDSHKWRSYRGKEIIPMWVADMDFQSPPEVIEALHRRVAHGVFGYAEPDAKLKEAIVDHLQRAYSWSVSPSWIIWLPGLVTGLNVACRTVGRPGAGVLTTVPIYPPFLTAPGFAGKKLQTSPMISSDGRWQIDMGGLHQAMDKSTALFLLCNPHNPTGRAFTRAELESLVDICLRHNLTICSDEIHCDLILAPEHRHIPTATISPEAAQRTITLMAPSKTYNIPGLGCAFAIIPNPKLRQRFKKAMAGIVPHVNIFGFTATLAAYQHGGPWLEALLEYLRTNAALVHQTINQLPGLTMERVEATYLSWLDTRATGIENPSLFFEHAGVGLSDGALFGAPGFVRMNFGCPRQLLETGLDRISRAIRQRSP